MSLKLGNSSISSLYLGSTSLSKAYLGSTEIFSGGVVDPVWDNLQSYYKFDETSGTTAYDSKGTINGTTTNTSIVSGKINNGLLFDDNLDKVDLGNNYGFTHTDSWTVSFWWKRTNTLTAILWAKYDGSNTGYQVYTNTTGNLYVLNRDGAAYNGMWVSGITDTSNFYHVIWTYNGGNNSAAHEVYINGVKQAHAGNYDVGTVTDMTNSISAKIGNRNSDIDANGVMDEFGIWNRVLTQSDVDKLYNSGAGLSYTP